MEIQSAIALRDHIYQRWCFNVSLTTAPLHDDFRWLHDRENAGSADLLGLTRISDVRSFELGAKLRGESDSESEHERGREHRPWWCANVSKFARPR